MLITKSQVVMIADGKINKDGKVFNIEDIKIPKDPIPVNYEFDYNKNIGEAKLHTRGKKIIASMIFKDTVSLKLINSKYASIGGHILSQKEKDVGGIIKEIKDITIDQIGISKAEDIDSRIKPL